MNANMIMSYTFLVDSLQWDSRMYMYLLPYAAIAAHTHPWVSTRFVSHRSGMNVGADDPS